MSYALAAGGATLVLMLVLALLWGQPAAVDQILARASADATIIAAIPTPTRRPLCPGWVSC